MRIAVSSVPVQPLPIFSVPPLILLCPPYSPSTGQHVSMADAMAEVRSHLGAPPDQTEGDDSKYSPLYSVYLVMRLSHDCQVTWAWWRRS